MIQGVLFDLGWTLMYADVNGDGTAQAHAALGAYLRANGFAANDDFSRAFQAARERGWKLADETGVEQPGALALAETFTQFGWACPDGLLARANDAFFGALGDKWHAYPDALATLRELARRGWRAGIISNADDNGLVHRQVQRMGFAPFVNPVLSSAAEPRWRKPDPRLFHLVSDAWQIAPREIVYVGDSPRYDTLGAHRAGMRAILLERGDGGWWQKVPAELATDPQIQPDATVKTLAEIPGVIEKM